MRRINEYTSQHSNRICMIILELPAPLCFFSCPWLCILRVVLTCHWLFITQNTNPHYTTSKYREVLCCLYFAHGCLCFRLHQFTVLFMFNCYPTFCAFLKIFNFICCFSHLSLFIGIRLRFLDANRIEISLVYLCMDLCSHCQGHNSGCQSFALLSCLETVMALWNLFLC